jgi:hypothetical protein
VRRFYCEIWGHEINKNQCFIRNRKDSPTYDSNPYCLNCLTLKVSPVQLKAFAQEEFQSMVKSEERHKEDRKIIRAKWRREGATERMQAKRTGRVREKKEPTSIYESTIKGKDKAYPNLFIYQLNYVLKREIERGNREVIEGLKIYNKADVYDWISRLFTANGYTKHNRENYTSDDVRKIVESLDKKESSIKDEDLKKTMRKWFMDLSDRNLLDFCDRTK